MTDDFKDIEPEVVQAILDNADAFIDVDNRAEDIIAWGEGELARLRATEKTVESFRSAAAELEAQVAEKLTKLEQETRARYTPEEE